MCDCDVPDLDLFPKKYGIKNIRFSAGIENSFLHLGLWCISWLIRLGLPINLSKYTNLLLKISDFFNFIGHQITELGKTKLFFKFYFKQFCKDSKFSVT